MSIDPTDASRSDEAERRTPVAQAAGLAIILGASETLFFAGMIPVLAFGVAQALCALGAIGIAFAKRREGALYGPYLALALWIAIAGAPGACVWLAATIAATVAAPRRAGARFDFLALTNPDFADKDHARLQEMENALIDERVRIEGANVSRSLLDALTGQAQAPKLKALSAIARYYDPRFARALRVALRDANPTVRVLAASVLRALQSQYEVRVSAKKAQATANPATPTSWMALGEEHNGYAQSGLLRTSQRLNELESALQCFAKAADLAPSDEPAKIARARALYDMERYEEAVAALSAGFTSDWHSAMAARLLAEARQYVPREPGDGASTDEAAALWAERRAATSRAE